MPEIFHLMRRHKVTPGKLAQETDRSVATVHNWLDGTYDPPGYIALTVEAVGKGLKPVTSDAMYGHKLTEVIGIPAETEWTWRYENQFPTAARLAVAMAIYKPSLATNQLTSYEKTIIFNVIRAGTYWRGFRGWRARPIMGKTPPPMRTKTPASLVQRGYLRLEGNRLTVTTKGRYSVG